MNPPSPLPAVDLPPLTISLGASAVPALEPGLPVLAGPTEESLFPEAQWAGPSGLLQLFRAGAWHVGGASVPIAHGLEQATREVYTALFAATRGLHLARIWHYIPAINEAGPGGLENYRAFCRGRSLAFEGHHGPAFKGLLPAASAVGARSNALTIVFAATTLTPRHVENPLQIPAYDYPSDYGPRAPSFARATVVAHPASATVYISGTAAIRGHATVAPHRFQTQLECTLENLRGISQACGLGPDLDRAGQSARHFKVYLRHATDHPAAASALQRHLLRPSDRVSYLRADICRESLLIEIEATLTGVQLSHASRPAGHPSS